MADRSQRILTQMQEDVRRLRKEVEEVKASFTLLERYSGAQPERGKLVTALLTESVNVYSGIEALIEKACKFLHIKEPVGPLYHRELLNIGREIGMIPEEFYDFFSNLMGVRHFFRHSYGMTTSEERVLEDLSSLPENAESVILRAEHFIRTHERSGNGHHT